MPNIKIIRWGLIMLAACLALAGLWFAVGETSPAFAQQTMDHSSFPQLAGPFETPQEVTAACLQCHTESATEVMATSHWTWLETDTVSGEQVGKANIINNYCVATASNEPRCTSCHIGYGWADNTFDFNEQNNVDCLVCHSQDPAYKKFPAGAGNPWLGDEPREFPAGSGNMWEKVDLASAAQMVGEPSRANCGSCHFFGGGGDAVKHGDLDSLLLSDVPAELDVHMGGLDFTCVTCHSGENHEIPGTLYTAREPSERVECSTCHTDAPHTEGEMAEAINSHSDVIACQTCHIPAYGRGKPTKMFWDWSTAGERDEDGKPIKRTNDAGEVIYDGQKGTFEWGSDVVPEYVWWNGQVEYQTYGETIDPAQPVLINEFLGGYGDGKIYPVKVFKGIQPYDTVNNVLAIPNLFPNNADDTNAYWRSYDWGAALASGMEVANQEFSGEFDFVETTMYWSENHTVAPASEALTCESCHTAEDGRLDFVALGYSDEDVLKLSQFPPAQPQPTEAPTEMPTEVPTEEPTEAPEATEAPTQVVEAEPTQAPAEQPASNNNLILWIVGIAAALVIAFAVFRVIRK